MSAIKVSETPICDFCASEEPHWSYPAKDFEAAPAPMPQESVGAWLACDACAALIQRNEYVKLAVRGLACPNAQVLVAAGHKDHALSEILRLHRGFRKNRSGKVQPFVREHHGTSHQV